jgi:hypothetical protein
LEPGQQFLLLRDVRLPRGDLLGASFQPQPQVAQLAVDAVQLAKDFGGYGMDAWHGNNALSSGVENVDKKSRWSSDQRL